MAKEKAALQKLAKTKVEEKMIKRQTSTKQNGIKTKKGN